MHKIQSWTAVFCLCFAVVNMGSSVQAEIVNDLHFPVLSLDSPYQTGEAVWWMQSQLRALQYRKNPPDGIFDETTQKQVKFFQDAAGLEPDGVMEKKDWQELVFGCLPVWTQNSQNSLWIEVDTARHCLILWKNQQEIKRYAVGIGKNSTPSPLGEWKIITKQKDWGNGFGTRWMGLNVP